MILIIYGTRPEYIKIKPLISKFESNNIPFKTLFTGQHKDIVEINSDYKLLIEEKDNENRLDLIIKGCLNIPNNFLDDVKYVLVQGDTTSVVGLSLTALHRKIKVIHLEAGLRTYDNNNPFPEENNRRIVSSIASIHLCPTILNAKNLKEEKWLGDIYVVGNTGLDNLKNYKKYCEYQNKVLVTLHRRENHTKIDKWFKTINNIAKKYNDFEFILPLHPNPNVKKFEHILTNVQVVNPLNHNELVDILIKTKLVITDSGGIQEECSFFNKKCLVCREVTERPESLGLTSFLVKDFTELEKIFDEHIENYVCDYISPFGDGDSSNKIVKILEKYYL